MSINRVNITGNLTRDPELRQTQGGSGILRFGVAVNDRRRNPQTGEWEDVPNFIDCTVFGNRAEALSRFLSKGMKVAVEGKLRWSQWEKDGQKRSKIEVIVDEIEFLSQGAAQNAQRPAQTTKMPQGYQNPPQRQMAPQMAPQAPQMPPAQQPAMQGGYVAAPGAYQPAMPQPPQIDGYYDEDIPF